MDAVKLIKPSLFLIATYIAVSTTGVIPLVSYFVLLYLALLSSSYVYKLTEPHKKIVFILSTAAIATYGLLLRYIDKIELWGDETNVIRIANLPFGDIARSVATSHVAVPPLDYWNMWVWKYVVSLIETPEVAFRLPYMAYHIAAAVCFALIFTKVGNKLVPVVAFLVYFFNPLLFLYSLEVRYYALTALGSTLILFLHINNVLFELRFLPLLLLLGLNSVFLYLLLIPFAFFYVLKNPKHLIPVGFFAISFFIIYPLLLVSPQIERSKTLGLIIIAFKQLITLQLPQTFHVGFFVLAVVIAVISKSWFQQKLSILVSIIFSVIAISSLAYYKGYFDFFVRHYLFIVPLIIYFLLIPLKSLSNRYRAIYLLLLLSIFVFPWINYDLNSLKQGNLYSKSPLGVREIYRTTIDNEAALIIAPNERSVLSPPVYDFYTSNIIWYSTYYPSVEMLRVKSTDEICALLEKGQRVVVVNVIGPTACNASPYYRAFESRGLHIIVPI